MQLNLERPLVFFDLETTGLNISTDRIVELSYIKLYPDGREEQQTMRLNPEMHIPAQATAVHHITDADVADCPTLKQVAPQIISVFADADVAGYNSNHFDVPMLAEQLSLVGFDFQVRNHRYVDVQAIFHKMEQRTLSAAYRFYCNADLEDAHSADADTRATYEVLKAQLDKYDNLQNSVEFLSEFTSKTNKVDLAGRIVRDEQGRERFAFGKHKDRLVSEVFAEEPSYYSWMMNGTFANDTKQVITELYNHVREEQNRQRKQQPSAASLEALKQKFPSKNQQQMLF